eukprot:Mycagemm_TRINITY_DN10140_c0_g2::TRINITY_DN10140_c0_g2_i1::g.5057::m.5057 type:complete len:113 gc:universal TRINITY_DN10140_c0_g2_i1:1423-1761(+)
MPSFFTRFLVSTLLAFLRPASSAIQGASAPTGRSCTARVGLVVLCSTAARGARTTPPRAKSGPEGGGGGIGGPLGTAPLSPVWRSMGSISSASAGGGAGQATGFGGAIFTSS